MKTLVTAAVLAAVVLAAPVAQACKGKSETTASSTDKKPAAQKSTTVDATAPAAAPAPAAADPFKLVSVDDLAKQLDAKKAKTAAVAVFDANSKETRDTAGIIPTSVLLSSVADYDLALLPKDKASPVVFYCANEKCTASHTAAKRAATAGHTDVAVLGAGIKGWVAAGKAVDKPVG